VGRCASAWLDAHSLRIALTRLRWLPGRTHCWWLVAARPELQTSSAVVALILCWSVSDVIRYTWAACGARCPAALQTLRYTAFIPLYPLGAGAEVMLMALALPAAQAGFRRMTMPNAWNLGFNYAHFLYAVLLAYPPLWLQLYGHMFRQRRHKLKQS
jgi:very-long-chain (3R)-3-hydroxyacyl-CoA dehydratase